MSHHGNELNLSEISLKSQSDLLFCTCPVRCLLIMQFPYCYIVAPLPLPPRKMKRGGDPFLTIAKFIKLKKQNNRKPEKKNGDPRPRK